MPRIAIFLGPSLPVAKARLRLVADYLPPVKRGDIERLLPDPPEIIGIIDGQFFQSLSVSPKEILRALRAGIQVIGSSSMGALRAVELERYGMLGIGSVFELYRCGRIDGDDEVAVVYSPDDGRPLSVPLVNIRLILDEAVRQGILDRAANRTLARRMKAVYFPERTHAKLMELAKHTLSDLQVAALQRYIAEHRPDAKRDDAIALLDAIGNRSQEVENHAFIGRADSGRA